MKKTLTALLIGSALSSTSVWAAEPKEVVEHYASLVHAVYSDSATTAQALDKALKALIATPSEATLNAAKEAWLAARVPYQQSEVFRFGNTIVDDWEGQLNAWPLDEGLIDYVDTKSYQHELGNPGATANIISSTSLQVGNDKLDTTNITPELLASLNELGGSEANVATGYHAIEFLLWGQDLNATGAGAGARPYTDFVQGEGCTNGHCDRRVAYLQAASTLLNNDLTWMTAQWAENTDNYRQALTAKPATEGLRIMLFGMGSLSLGELAGERMKVALEANSPEDEHDCFSDNTHNSHYYNQQGINNVWFGSYTRVDGSKLTGPSLNDLVASKDKAVALKTSEAVKSATTQVYTLVSSAEQGQKFDQLIAANNAAGHELVNNSIRSLVVQTGEIEKASNVLGIYNLNPDTADHEF
ncbi:imelysin family protein [Motilimonas sp. E26]|uniref:imelysin family protein n=1 Tax=Motilimonas sp. E26 TaxID=2865674 RepID=UPI001E2A4905|nr:imelysin family protein [Motilimonas sp. E26]MCE0557693.1 peptidase [Motilimonas sp. E26]